jgi:hypothetical protein
MKNCLRGVPTMEMKLVKKLKTSYRLVMSKKLLCHTMGRRTVIFNTETWEKVAELLEPKNPGDVLFSKDDELLIHQKHRRHSLCL